MPEIPLLAIIAITIVLFAVYFLFVAQSPGQGQVAKKKGPVFNAPPDQEASRNIKIAKLEGIIEALKLDLEKAKQENSGAAAEIEKAKQETADARADLKRRQDRDSANEEVVNKLKRDATAIKEQLVSKEKEMANEFSKNVDFTRTIRDMNMTIEGLEKANTLKAEEIEKLKHKVVGHEAAVKAANAQVQELQKTIADYKKQLEESEWIPKKEFKKLNDEFTELEKELEDKEHQLELKDEKLKEVYQRTHRLEQQFKDLSTQPVAQAEPGAQAESAAPIPPAQPVQASGPAAAEPTVT
ncbi:MAG: hypothetical protein WC547_10090, partial [Candidatus Omnitrophota bacterium]